ncbi:hypothetical protein BJ170DRAFT_43938 [Xylariales sp. AK1849]|nr:hypothetical protein BJ170DRAFT_43938 [Xylariales sp. AK1849]
MYARRSKSSSSLQHLLCLAAQVKLFLKVLVYCLPSLDSGNAHPTFWESSRSFLGGVLHGSEVIPQAPPIDKERLRLTSVTSEGSCNSALYALATTIESLSNSDY